jgi:hypothetical protein
MDKTELGVTGKSDGVKKADQASALPIKSLLRFLQRKSIKID